MSIASAKRQIQSVLDNYQPKLDTYPALLGDGLGNVSVANRPGYVYIRMGDEETVGQAYNQRVSLREHLPVIVGYDNIEPRLFQVLSSRQSVYLSAGYPIIPNVPAHHITHEWPNINDTASDGSDVVYARWRQIQDLRISIDTGFTVKVTRSPVYRDAVGWVWIATQSIDLSGYQPALQAVYMLIYLDDNGILQEREGANVPRITIDISDCPDPLPGEFPLAAVLLYAGQTGLSDDRDEQNIIDLRWPQTYQAKGSLITAADVIVEEIGASTFDDVQDWINNTQSAGYITGGLITIPGAPDGTVDVSAIKGFLKTTDSETGITQSFDLAGANLALTNNRTNYIYVNYVAGPVWAVTVDRDAIEMNRQFTVGRVYREGNDVHIIQSGVQLPNFAREEHRRVFETRPFDRASGGVISEVGARYLGATAGVFYIGRNRTLTAAVDTSGADTFRRWYHVAGAWSSDLQSQICAADYQYDDGTDLANMTLYGVFWVFIHFDSDLHVVVGRDNYKLADAQTATVPALPDMVLDFSILAAKVIIKFNGVNFTIVESGYEHVFPGASIIDHNDTGAIQGGAVDDYYHLTVAQYTPVRGDLYYGDATPEMAHLAIGAIGDILGVNAGGTLPEWIAAPGGVPHNFLSVTHSDTDPQAVSEGSLVYGNATPAWTELVHPGFANHVLQSTAAQVGWSANAVTFPAAGAVPVGTGANTQIAYWTAANTLAGSAGFTYIVGTSSVAIAGHLAVGAVAAIDVDTLIKAEENATKLAGTTYGVRSQVFFNPAAGASSNAYGYQGGVVVGTAQANTGSCVGVEGVVTVTDTIAATGLILYGLVGYTNVQDASAVRAVGARIITPYVDTGACTTGYGIWMQQGVVGAGSITTLYGIYMVAITAGATNYAIYSAGGASYHAGAFSIGGTVAAAAQLHVDNAGTVARPVLTLDQGDVSEEMMSLITTIGVGNAIEAKGAKTLTPTHFIKITIPGPLTRYIQCGTIA